MAIRLRQIKNPYLRNLFFSVEDIPTNPLVHIFLYVTLTMGLSFALFADPTGAIHTALYKITAAKLGGIATNLWGISALVAFAVTAVSYIYRRKWLGHLASYLGFGVWAFVAIIYLIGGIPIGFFVFSIPNLVFWTWLHLSVSKYHARYTAGLYPRPKHGRIES